MRAKVLKTFLLITMLQPSQPVKCIYFAPVAGLQITMSYSSLFLDLYFYNSI